MKFFGKIWGVYAIVVFMIEQLFMMLIVVPTLLINKGHHIERKLLKLLFTTNANILLFFFGIRNKVRGFEQLDPNRNYIVVSNHNTAMDIIANSSAAKGRPFKFLAKAELLKAPILGANVRRLCISVDRSSSEARKKSFDAMEKCLNQKMDVLIYPEGTRNRTDQPLKQFYAGAFKLAERTGHSIAICVLKNVKQINNPDHGTWLVPGKIESVWKAPISPEGKSMDELKAEVQQTIIQELKN